MARWLCKVYVLRAVHVSVDAESEEEAFGKAREEAEAGNYEVFEEEVRGVEWCSREA